MKFLKHLTIEAIYVYSIDVKNINLQIKKHIKNMFFTLL